MSQNLLPIPFSNINFHFALIIEKLKVSDEIDLSIDISFHHLLSFFFDKLLINPQI